MAEIARSYHSQRPANMLLLKKSRMKVVLTLSSFAQTSHIKQYDVNERNLIRNWMSTSNVDVACPLAFQRAMLQEKSINLFRFDLDLLRIVTF